MSSLIGPVELHSDNSIALGKGLFQLMAMRTLPQQAVPTTTLLCETFQYKYGEVVGDQVDIRASRDYFFRPRVCYSAWRNKKVKHMNCLVGNHPLEDVIHIHAWVHLHHMHMGKLPSCFYFMPRMVPRSAELVPGRIYPVLDSEGLTGTICACPEGKSYVLLVLDGCEPRALHLAEWHRELYASNLQVAPLIFRKHAVVQRSDKSLGVLAMQRVRPPTGEATGWRHEYDVRIHPGVGADNYLDYDGNYLINPDEGPTHWRDAHAQLVALGTHIYATKASVVEALPRDKAKMPGGNYTHVKGWLRYPDECDEGYQRSNSVCVAFRVSAQAAECDDVCILALSPEHCRVAEDSDRPRSVDRLLP